MKKYIVKNLPSNYSNYKYMVIRDCFENGYWYYGCYSNLMDAHMVANEIGNGILVETEQVSSK